MLKSYYLNILDLSVNSTEKDIKRAYRKKAMQYHPDKNQSNNAEEMFIKINEAYEYLTSPEAKRKVTPQTKSPEELKKEELRERMKQAQAFYSKRKKEENRAQLKKFNVFKQTFLFQTSKQVILFGLILSLILILDRSFEKKELDGYVYKISQKSNSKVYNFITTKGSYEATFYKSGTPFYAKKNNPVTLHFSPILKDLMEVTYGITVKNSSSIHYFSELIFTLLLFPILGLVYRNPSLQSYWMIHISYIIPIVVGIYILFKLI